MTGKCEIYISLRDILKRTLWHAALASPEQGEVPSGSEAEGLF